jgi:hypothetical protein
VDNGGKKGDIILLFSTVGEQRIKLPGRKCFFSRK